MLKIFSIPADVVSGCVLPFLSVRDLQSLDTALTCKLLRPQLRKAIESYYYVYPDNTTPPSIDDLRWLCQRGVNIVSISISGQFESSMVCEFIATKMPYLKQCTILSKDISNESLLQLATGCSGLELLHLSFGHYSDAAVQSLAENCKQLRSLRLHSSDITDASIRSLCVHCPNLQCIGLYWCLNLTDNALVTVARAYPHLQKLDISGCYFSDNAVVSFASLCHELRSIALSFEDITSDAFASLVTSNSKLQHVTIIRSDTLRDTDIITLAQCCTDLREVHLEGCSEITDAAISSLAGHCPQLTSLNVDFCLNINESAVLSICEHCPHIKSLSLADGCYVSDLSLFALGQSSHELISFKIAFIRCLTDAAVEAFATGCPLLQEFTAIDTNITDYGVTALAKSCRDLRKVNLTGCRPVGVKGISALAKHCPLLCEMRLTDCQVNNACLYAIAQHCRHLLVLRFDPLNVTQRAKRAVAASCSQLQHLL